MKKDEYKSSGGDAAARSEIRKTEQKTNDGSEVNEGKRRGAGGEEGGESVKYFRIRLDKKVEIVAKGLGHKRGKGNNDKKKVNLKGQRSQRKKKAWGT